MKKEIKEAISSLLAGKKRKKDLIIVSTFQCEPGYFNHNGKVINTADLEILSLTTNMLIILKKKVKDEKKFNA